MGGEGLVRSWCAYGALKVKQSIAMVQLWCAVGAEVVFTGTSTQMHGSVKALLTATVRQIAR